MILWTLFEAKNVDKQFLDVRRSWLWVILLTELLVSGTLSKVSIQWCAFLTGVQAADCCCFGFTASGWGILWRSVGCIWVSVFEEFAVLNEWITRKEWQQLWKHFLWNFDCFIDSFIRISQIDNLNVLFYSGSPAYVAFRIWSQIYRKHI